MTPRRTHMPRVRAGQPRPTPAFGPRTWSCNRMGRYGTRYPALDAIAVMPEGDRVLAERVHAIVIGIAPHLLARTWHGMPAYADGKDVRCFFQGAATPVVEPGEAGQRARPAPGARHPSPPVRHGSPPDLGPAALLPRIGAAEGRTPAAPSAPGTSSSRSGSTATSRRCRAHPPGRTAGTRRVRRGCGYLPSATASHLRPAGGRACRP